MPEEDSAQRRTRSVSFTSQSCHDDIYGGIAGDPFTSKRVRATTVLFMCCRHVDPVVCFLKLLRLILQRSVMLAEGICGQMKKCVSRFCGNLKWFLQNYPPVVLFTFSIALFAIVLTLLAVYVSKTQTLSKVDVSQDWNMFLSSFSNLEFCVIQDNSTYPLKSEMFPRHKPHSGRQNNSNNVRTTSVKMSLTIHPTKEFVSVQHRVMHLSASMVGKYIGLKGDESKHKLNVTVVVPYQWNVSSCSNLPLQGCQIVEMDVCVELAGPRELFPISRQKPQSCSLPSLSRVDFWAPMNWQLNDVDSLYYCRSRTMVSIRHEYDPSLIQPLKKPHRSVIRLHLLHTSFFLYMFVVMVCVYAVIFNHARQTSLSQTENPVYEF